MTGELQDGPANAGAGPGTRGAGPKEEPREGSPSQRTPGAWPEQEE